MMHDTVAEGVPEQVGLWLESGAGQLLAMLIAGHVLGDFVFQSGRMVREKRDSAQAGGVHALHVTFWQGLACAPFLTSFTPFLLVLSVGVAHFWIDRAKVLLEARDEPRMRWLLLDQGLHAISLVLIWKLWIGLGLEAWPGLSESLLHQLAAVAVVVAVFGANVNGGSAVVSYVLRWIRPKSDDEDPPEPAAGRIIGILERLMILTLAWQGEWGAVGMVIAAKSVARFKELDDKSFAEAYIVGTLTSVLFAMAGGLVLRAVLG